MENDLPFQVSHLIDQLLNKSDNIHVRANFRNRLDSIRREIDKSIKKYDNEMLTASSIVRRRPGTNRRSGVREA
jgi:hypothetical protein